MKTFCILLMALIAQATSQHEWESFKETYGKSYSSYKENAKRYKIFSENLNLINEHNKLYETGKSSYYLAINEFADMTNEEFVARFNGYSPQGKVYDPKNEYVASNENLPGSVDWRDKGYVTSVKDQGQCKSYWAFSAVGAMEGAHFKKTNKLVELSAQNLVDCDKRSYGCDGGYMNYAFMYLIENGGIDTDSSYPYEAVEGQCRFNKSTIGATISLYWPIKIGSEEDLTAAIAKEGPISVGFNARGSKFQFYRGGVYDKPACNSFDLNHGMLAVGYGSVDGKDCYFIKNSWGKSWGFKGYIFTSRNKNNQCGVASDASFPIA